MLGAAQRALAQAFGLRREELKRVLPLTVAYGVVLASLYVLKPARNALFLAKMGIEQLPYVLLLVALVGGAFALAYGRLTRSLSIDALVQRTFLLLIVMLGGFRALLWSEPPSWVFYAFYIWVALYGLVTTSLVWLLANGIFTSREARRVFGLIGSGGIAGAIVGGIFTGELAERLGTENLLVICMALLFLCIGLFRLLPNSSRTEVPRRGEDAARGVPVSPLSSPLLRHLAVATGLIAAVAVIVDVQFNQVVDQAFPQQDEKAAFFGRFFATLSAFSFVFQLVLTPVILRVLGVGAALTILPAALGLGSVGLLLLPGLLTGLVAKSADGGFRHSVHKAASEVLFLPVPSEVKKQSKLFLDTTVDTTATGIGAISVLVLTQRLGLAYETLSLLSIVLMVATMGVIRSLRRAYVDAFRHALESRHIDLAQLRTSLAEAGALELLRPALRSDQPRKVVYALDLLSDLRERDLAKELDPLLSHPSVEVRRRALEVRARQEAPLDPSQLEAMLQDEDVDLRASALGHLAGRDSDRGASRIEQALNSESPEMRTAALGALAQLNPEVAQGRLHPDQVEGWLDEPAFQPLEESEGPAEPTPWAAGRSPRSELARTLARLGDPALSPALQRLVEGAEPAVVRAAIEGIGRGKNQAWLGWLMAQLDKLEHRSAVRAALVDFGSEAVPDISKLMEHSDLAPSVRRALPRVLARIPTQSSVEVLMSHIEAADPSVARAVRRALAKLRTNFDDLRFDKRRVQAAIRGTAARFYKADRALGSLAPQLGDGAAAKLLLRSLEEAKDQEIEAVLDLLTLRHDPYDIESARKGFAPSASPSVRSSALELLENVVEKASRQAALAVLDDGHPELQQARGAALFGELPEGRSADAKAADALLDLLDSPNAWLRACAAHVAAERGEPRLLDRVQRARDDANTFVREAARSALAAIRGPETEFRLPT